MSGSPEVLITARFFDEQAVEALRGRGIRIHTGGVSFDAVDPKITNDMHAALERSSAWILGMAPVSRDLLERYPRLQIVARRSSGKGSYASRRTSKPWRRWATRRAMRPKPISPTVFP